MAGEPGYDIYEYSRKGSLVDLREALQSGSKVDEYMAYDGSTGLVIAARQGFGPIVRELIRNGANSQVRTDDGSNMLHHAASGGSTEAMAALLQTGLDINEPNEDHTTPLILASHYGHGDVVKLLCSSGADVNLVAEGWGTALDSAHGPCSEILESLGATRSEGGLNQPIASGAEKFHYGCFESGTNPHQEPLKNPGQNSALAGVGSLKQAVAEKPKVGDKVKLAKPKSGLLQDGDVGEVIGDDGSDSVPLKVKLGDGYDYYEYHDVIVCKAEIVLPPDSDRATAEGTARYLQARLHPQVKPSVLGDSGLQFAPIGFGCHRISDEPQHRMALTLALKMGCNLVDLAPNYTDGMAETVAGDVLRTLIDSGEVRRDELIIATKVGNVLGQQMAFSEGVEDMTVIDENLSHCISPAWIEQEITRSLERLQLKCVDCLLLHCPECEAKADGVDMVEVYKRLGVAFRYLETEVARGRIQTYGVSAAFIPLRPTDPEHLDLDTLVAQLPARHHFRVLQFPLNFAEAQINWVGHLPRTADGVAIDKDKVATAPTLFEAAKKHGFVTLTNRPLDGIFKESHGVLRFSSLDCDVRSFSELQLDNCDSLEEKLSSVCRLQDRPYNQEPGATGNLAGKTVKVLSSLEGVDCVLLGMRHTSYVLGTLPLTFGTPPVPAETAAKAFKALHNTIEMWFATAIHEADHGTSKTWRLPVAQKFEETTVAGA